MHSSTPSTRTRRLWLKLLGPCLFTIVLLGIAELTTRLWLRFQTGAWPRTQAVQGYEQAMVVGQIYRLRPYLGAGPRGGQRAELGGRAAGFNSLGYRSPERPADKLVGAVRVLCSGGSTTFDLLSPNNELTWPWRLEERLRDEGRQVQVWNAGFPGWTSLESLISLANRDLDLQPDWVVLYQGINDLQPAGHQPFDPTYEEGHFPMLRAGLGFDTKKPGILGRSVLVEKLAGKLRRTPAKPERNPRPEIPAPALATFRRNVTSFIAVAREHGAKVLLVTQPLRIREAQQNEDRQYLETWVPGASAEEALVWLDSLNEALRELAAEHHLPLADAARGIEWQDAHFADPMHYSREGAEALAAFLAEQLGAQLDGPAPN